VADEITVIVPAGEDPDTYVPTTYVGHPIPPNQYCRGWNSKREHYCSNEAGKGTTHFGTGRCMFHGGLREGDGRIRYDHRYSRRMNERYAELVEQFAEDEDPLNLVPEIDMLRALFVDFINRYDETTEALLAWHASFGKEDREPKPRKVMDIADASKVLDRIGKMVDRIRTRKVITVISPEVQDRLRSQIAVINRREHWTSAELLETLSGVWQ
jgi:hypothetical protein